MSKSTAFGQSIRRLSAALKPGSYKLVAPETSSLANFLQSTKEKYLSDIRATPSKGNEWTVVMGNESGGISSRFHPLPDLDSVASSIAYAWLHSETRKKLSIPLIQIARDDLHLRAENLYALEIAGITDQQLLSITDVDAITPFPSHTFALVDHNRLSDSFSNGNPSARVVAVIDHHEDEQLYTDSADPRQVEPAGSCSSHVASLYAKDEEIDMPTELATLLLSAILVDTDCLRPGGKAIQADRDAASYLIPLSTLSGSLPSNILSTGKEPSTTRAPVMFSDIPAVKWLSDELSSKKMEVSHLSASDLLRRDYKEYTYTLHWHPGAPTIKAGLATVPVKLNVWGSGGTLEREAQQWMDRQGLSLLGVLTSFRDAGKFGEMSGKGKHKREMAWFVRDGRGDAGAQKLVLEEIASRLWTGLEANGEIRVEKHKMDLGKSVYILPAVRARVYKQGNANATRKVTAPLLKNIMESSS
ncbi:exopolyphosphatase [Mycena pura]|uniref:Exopolyphosphatase n=1 Tax=Mycena pura TaxID=153505 RepID=A0AAD6VQ89_9AGAR|nr:exopolyphosphatase [Mycena pura]